MAAVDRRSDRIACDDEARQTMNFSPLVCTFAVIWIILGMYAFVRSLYCFGRRGSFGEKVFGFVLAVFFGPFYLLWAGYNSSKYCT